MNVQDRRRLLGPANASPIVFSDVKEKKSKKIQAKPDDEISKMFINTGLVKNCDGSAYIEVGNTIIQVSIYGPRPIRGSFIDKAILSTECRFLPYLSQPNDSISRLTSSTSLITNYNGKLNLSNIEQKISSYIESCFLSCIYLENYPKSSIDIFIKILSVDTNLLNLVNDVVHCCSLAMVDAQIESKDLITSGNLRYLKSNNHIIMDPKCKDKDKDITNEVVEEGKLDLVVSFMNSRNDEIVGFWCEGNDTLEDDVLEKLIERCNDMSKEIRKNINFYLIESLE
ncbi:hypothetical protein PACTADRAFT_39267 [Pachysolen tannophilus NRRL Y-2460]|uniref:Exoribonuclease phosphorolytic domain-containing protein n=1 Tax=Pachysolen tannophilus NRRL Y-2460 TaxID=669874 RepID=A0A1E4TZ90_PACTA|nr:hypothetical protein PACTADRAFT_39267 [Pachysolen tannophilus NRRL Y-2460]